MASSSDESFTWTNASNSSESSIEKDKMTNHNGTVNGSDDDCDYESSYKKKLHKKLSLNNETTGTTHEETKNERKRKRLDDVVESPKKKKIKLEPESDADTSKKKKKKSIDHSQSNEDSKVDGCEDQNNLNTVKQESDPELLSPKVKKHKKNSLNLSVNLSNDVTNTTLDTNNLNHSEDNDESYTSKKKKKKSKKKKNSESDDNNEKKAKFCEEKQSHTQDEEMESENTNLKNEAIMPKMEIASEDEVNNLNNSELSSEEEKANKNNIKLKSIDKSLNETNDHSAKTKKRVSIKSEKTKADNEGNSTIDHDISIGVNTTDSRKLQKFLKVNGNLKPILNKERGDWVVSPDDEVWAIRCPHNIDINAFLGVNIKLDRKYKIKVDGQTYVGTMNSETDSVTVLSLQNNNYVIKKIPLNGTLHLRKRIPKINIEHNTTTNNELDFVPLPVTKNRHPLFGSNYKKAIKVPSSIAQRLKDPYGGTICDNEKVKKSKKKKHKSKSLDIDNEQLEESKVSVLENDESRVEIKKKNRKRKHEVEDEHSNSKRVKHSDSTVWESEQAIEENLFNF